MCAVGIGWPFVSGLGYVQFYKERLDVKKEKEKKGILFVARILVAFKIWMNPRKTKEEAEEEVIGLAVLTVLRKREKMKKRGQGEEEPRRCHLIFFLRSTKWLLASF